MRALGLGWVFGLAVMIAATKGEAQTTYYYYYPSSAPAAPTVTAPTTTTDNAPRYYRWGLFGRRAYWTTYAQPSQATYAPQPSQPADQAQAAPASGGVQYVETGYVAPATEGAKTDAKPVEDAKAKESQPTEDPYGFTTWLNATRAAYGLSAVGYDPNLSGWAASNNEQQAARGMGHFVMGPARRQNAAMGGYPGVEAMWMASPAHRAALLDPTIHWIGIAALGAYWTFNAN